MNTQEEQIAMPGDKLGIIEQYLPGEGTYDDNGEIKSAVLGNVKINQKKKVISVVSDAKPALLKVGDTVYGQITDIKPQRANVKIECMKDNARPLALPYMGAIHISQAKKDYLENICEGHYDEVCETLDFYEESVIHYGEGFDTSWLFFMDELKYTYGEYELIRKIQKIIQ